MHHALYNSSVITCKLNPNIILGFQPFSIIFLHWIINPWFQLLSFFFLRLKKKKWQKQASLSLVTTVTAHMESCNTAPQEQILCIILSR